MLRRFVPLTLLLAGCQGSPDQTSADLRERLVALGATACADPPDFLCLSISVPLDHDAPDGPTLDVRFAVRPATGPDRRGVLLTVDGGPGYSGVEDAGYYTQYYLANTPALGESFDLAFSELRGLGPERFNCPVAAEAFYKGGLRGGTPAEDAVVGTRAATFSQDCFAEMGAPVDAPHYTTLEAAHDLEAFRAAIGEETLTLYGLSYGTQLTQTYAALFPQRVRALTIDGVVDLSVSDATFAADLTRSTNDVLGRTFAACSADPACAADMGGDPAAAYDALAKAAAMAPLPVTFPLASGGTVERPISLSELDAGVTAAVVGEEGRPAFLRALAAASTRGEYVPLRRLLSWASEVDPETNEGVGDPAFSDAVYYTITCNDYGHPPGDSDAARQAPYLAVGAALRQDPSLRVFSAFYGDLPCATWPKTPPERLLPAPFVPSFPLLILNSDADTLTPYAHGAEMWKRLHASNAPASAITISGGHHVMLASGAPCVDETATHFFLDPTEQLHTETQCMVPFQNAYIPMTPANAADLPTALAMVSALETEVIALPGLIASGGIVGCDQGGRVEADGAGALTFTGCSFAAGLSFDGAGTYKEGDSSLDVTVSGAHQGSLKLTHTGATRHVTGTLDGKAVDETS